MTHLVLMKSLWVPGLLSLAFPICFSISVSERFYHSMNVVKEIVCRSESQLITASVCRRRHSPSCSQDSLPMQLIFREIKTWLSVLWNRRRGDVLGASATLLGDDCSLKSVASAGEWRREAVVYLSDASGSICDPGALKRQLRRCLLVIKWKGHWIWS